MREHDVRTLFRARMLVFIGCPYWCWKRIKSSLQHPDSKYLQILLEKIIRPRFVISWDKQSTHWIGSHHNDGQQNMHNKTVKTIILFWSKVVLFCLSASSLWTCSSIFCSLSLSLSLSFFLSSIAKLEDQTINSNCWWFFGVSKWEAIISLIWKNSHPRRW